MKGFGIFVIFAVIVATFLIKGVPYMHGETKIVLTSPSFKNGERIPRKHTCEGEDVSPALEWQGIPSEAKSLALIVDDPDAPLGTWVHWVVYNIPVKRRGFDEGVDPVEVLEDGVTQGKNDWGKTGYRGPCPPSGVHRYFFKLYALGENLGLEPGLTKKDLLKSMEGHIIGKGELVGTYSRQ